MMGVRMLLNSCVIDAASASVQAVHHIYSGTAVPAVGAVLP